MENRVSELLMTSGIPPSMKGFRYLHTAILLVYNQPDMAAHASMHWYKLIAKENGVSVCSAEKSMRYAIAHAWDDVTSTKMGKYFPIECAEGKAPAVSIFVASLAECLRIQGG